MSETISPLSAELTVVIISYNTRALTLKCLETLYATTRETRFHTVVLDNASSDGSVEAISEAFPQVELIASADNHGFARANNIVLAAAKTEWVLLLNPDTECHAGAVDNLLAFSRAHPEAGITGGRTVFPDGSLNPDSCQMRQSLWSVFCWAVGLTRVFRGSRLFNPEAMGNWARDSVREVDIVVGCFLMIRRSIWNELGGFDLKYVMYGEETDLCLRAIEMGYRPMITPEAQIMHLVGASSASHKARLQIMVAKARLTLMQDHWPPALVPFGRALMGVWAGLRVLGSAARTALTGGGQAQAQLWSEVWQERHDWMPGYR